MSIAKIILQVTENIKTQDHVQEQIIWYMLNKDIWYFLQFLRFHKESKY